VRRLEILTVENASLRAEQDVMSMMMANDEGDNQGN